MKLSSLLAFGFQDLKGSWPARWISAAIILTVLVVCAVTVAAYGLAYGAREVKHASLAGDPLALVLWIGDSVIKNQVTAVKLSQVDQQIKSNIARRFDYLGAHPFRVFELIWIRSDGESMIRLQGRTIRIASGEGNSDPLPKSCPLQPGGRYFAGSDGEGVVLSPSLLLELGFQADAPTPKSLTVNVLGQRIEVPVLGVMKTNLPGCLHFVMTEKYEYLLRTGRPDPPIKCLYSGPLHPQWPAQEAFPAAVRTALADWNVKCVVETRKPPLPPRRGEPRTSAPPPDERILSLQSEGQRGSGESSGASLYRLSEWRSLVARLHKLLREASYPAYDAFEKIDARGQDNVPRTPPRAAYDMAGLYFLDVDALEPAAAVCESIFPVERDVIRRLQTIDAGARAVIKTLTAFEACMIFMAAVNLVLIQVLRAMQKLSEAGMLKAVGTSNQLLSAIALVEAAYLWLAGAVPGIVLGIWSGRLISRRWLYSDPVEAAIGFSCPHWLWLLVFLGAGAVCLASGYFTTRPWRTQSAAELLHTNS